MIIGIDGNEANVKKRVGINQYAAGLLCALEKLPDATRQEFVVYLKDRPLMHLPKERLGWTYKVLGGKPLWVITRLMPHIWFEKKRSQVLFSPSHYVPLFSPIPVVMSVMDLGYLKNPEQFKKSDFYQLKYWGALSMWRAKKIIAISNNTKKDILSHYGWTKNKVEVVYPGYYKKNYYYPYPQYKVEMVKRKYNIVDNYILFLSTLKPSKNIEGLLEAFRLLIANISEFGRIAANINLVIAGKKGWLYESVFKKIEELGLKNFVIFTDFVDEADKPALLAGAKVLVSPSFWEGFGMHVLEAMVLGTPVVVSEVGSLPEVVGDAGVIVNPQDPKDIAFGIQKALLDSPSLRKKGFIQADKFSWEKAARKTLKLLKLLE